MRVVSCLSTSLNKKRGGERHFAGRSHAGFRNVMIISQNLCPRSKDVCSVMVEVVLRAWGPRLILSQTGAVVVVRLGQSGSDWPQSGTPNLAWLAQRKSQSGSVSQSNTTILRFPAQPSPLQSDPVFCRSYASLPVREISRIFRVRLSQRPGR